MDIEQTTEQQTETTSGVSRDELIAAVREAGGTESVDVAAEEAAAAARAEGAEGAATTAEQTAPVEEEEPRIARILKAREQAHREQEAARNLAQETIERARQESERMLQEARQRAEQEWQAEIERRRQAFQANPTEQIRAIGNGDTQAVVDAVLRDGSPEGRAIQQLQKELAETKQQVGATTELSKQIQEMRLAEQQRIQAAEVERVRAQFMGVATQERAPHLHARFDEAEIFDRANSVAKAWRSQGMRIVQPGAVKGDTDFDFDDVVTYLENDSRKKLAPILAKTTPAQQVSAGAPVTAPGNAPKVQANGSRTLSAAQGSERRTSPKPLSELTPQQQREALIAEVAAARRANPDATS